MIVEEKTISSDRIYTGKVISLKVDTVEIENKGYQKREIVEHQGAVAIVALTDDDKVVLIKQFRKPIEQVIWEIPAGKLEIGENPKDCAIRELKEELKNNMYPVDLAEILREVDEKRSAFQEQCTATRWGDGNEYDLCIDTGKIGIEKAAELILQYIEYRK